MDLATIVGVIAGISAIVISIYLGGTIDAFIDFPSMFIVFGGTIAATLINFPLSDIISVLGVVKNAFLYKASVPHEVINRLVSYAEMARMVRAWFSMFYRKCLEKIIPALFRWISLRKTAT